MVTIWTIIALPLLAAVLFGMAEAGRLWHARAQLENTLEAAALAAVRDWGDRGGGAKNLAAACATGRACAEANAVNGIPVDFSDRKGVPSVAWSFGTAAPGGDGYEFTPAPDATARFAVVLQASVRVAKLCRPLFGASLGESTVTATTVAYYDPNAEPRRARLIRISASP